MIRCQRCKIKIDSFSVMRKWCVDCRKAVAVEQAKARRTHKTLK